MAEKLYTMTKVCEQTGLSYQALKYYCNEGLIPYVRRDARNRRAFDEHMLAWVKDLSCLKKCNMSIVEMKEYLALCLEGKESIPKRKEMLDRKAAELEEQIRAAHESLDYIAWKQRLYDDFLSGKVPFESNLTQD